MTTIPPFIWFFLGALAIIPLRGWARNAVLLLIPALGGMGLLGVAEGTVWQLTLMDYTLTPLRVDKLSLLFGYLFHLAAFIAFVFALHVRDTVQHVAGLFYAGSAIGAAFAGDLISLFIFWEIMAFSSAFLIFARRTERARAAGLRYLIIQVLSGVLLLAGALVYLQETGSLAFDYIGLTGIGGWLIFIAFGIKCAFPLLHNWLTDAYPEATPTGTVFLTAFTTKVAVYALARGFPGTELLVYIGVTMTCFPIFYAVIENDLRRVLSYSMINQIGFMVCGIGIGTQLAINGAVAHAFNDVLFKGLLMMSMGAVLYRTGRINGSDLGGLYKTMPITAGFCMVGAASISAFPLFSGFVSKSLVMVATLEEGYHWVWLGLLFASAGVFHHAGIKIPYFAFFGHDSGIRASEPPLNMLIAMGMAATICIFIGVYPFALYDLLPYPVTYFPFDGTHVIAQLQILFFSALAFVWLQKNSLYPPELRSVNLDVEWLYRGATPRAIHALVRWGGPVDSGIRGFVHRQAMRLVGLCHRVYGPRSAVAGTYSSGLMVLWVAALLGVYLIFYLK
ncbi:MAG: Na(+)/H(+) antiporter subunit D [Gammaproteobacteria bacterium]|nr:Na(+)/H(+) antiporter subunit D [Gammaproteobacteria bacterium]NNJ83842.1 Na(+)/H(+) antiporter subunit D [Gammaproteobacteria bacterium]